MAEENESKERIILDFQTNADEASREVNNLNVKIEQTIDSTDQQTQSVTNQENAYKSLKAQLREANMELQKAVQIYGETSEEAIKAAKGVADLKDQMGFAKDLADQFNPDQKFKALGAATQVAATGMQGVTAGMALFGDQSEATEKALLQVQAAMAFSDAISQMSDLGDQWALLKTTIGQSSIATKANTAATGAAAIAQKLFTGSVNTTSTSFKALKGAIAATGIGLLVVGVAALANNFDKVKEVVLDLVPGLSKAGDVIMNVGQAVTDFVGVTSEADRQIQKQKSRAEEALSATEKYLERHENTLSESQKRELELRSQYFERIKEGRFSEQEARKIYNEALAKDEREAAEKRAKEAEEARKKAEAEREKERKERAAKEKAAREKREEEAKKEAERLAQIQKDANAFQAENDLREIENKVSLEQEQLELLESAIEKSNKLEEERFEENKKRTEAELQLDKENKQSLVSNGEQLLKNVQSLAGKNKAIQKAAIIADGTISAGKAAVNTAEAVTKDLAKGAPFSAPLVALDLAVGATSIAAIVSNTAKALKAVGGGSISAGASVPSVTGASASPQTGFQASSENQIATSVANAQNNLPVIKTFVTGKDVTDQQTLDANLLSQNTFGGSKV